MEDRCLDCHGEPYVKNGRTIHPKAGLALNTYEFVLKGNLDGPIIDRGDHEESTLYVVMTLDPDDSELMPPKGEPLTEDEISLFKQWIDEGAKEYPSDVFERPKEEKASACTGFFRRHQNSSGRSLGQKAQQSLPKPSWK